MAHPSDARLLVLHGVRLKGFAEASDVAEIVDLAEAFVADHLAKAEADGLAARRDTARLKGWTLTADGKAEHLRLLADELLEAGQEPAVRSAYEGFMRLNAGLLCLCTEWQMMDETTINDHADADYDREVVERLVGHHAGLEAVLAELERALARYQPYRRRFEAAIERLAAGDGDWFTKPMIDSYHTVWFQLHEDLLNTLGIDRAAEPAVQRGQ